MKSTFFLLSFFLTTLVASSQQGTNVFPPSPEASSLGKFVETPVSYYTGLPQIDIPFFFKKIDNVSLNIGISYHAQGIKVDEVASHVGIGWALKAGGLITRQTRDAADDSSNGYLKSQNGKFLYPALFIDTAFRANILSTLNAGGYSIDTNPDIYIFNFMGLSGKFIIDCTSRKTIIQKFTDLVINPIFDIDGLIVGFECIDDTGNKYYFGEDNGKVARDSETSESFLYTQNNGQYSSTGTSTEINFNTWHLLKIITSNQNVINFKYDVEEITYYRKSTDEIINNSYNSAFSKINAKQYQIKEITFDDGKVNFNKSTVDREDLEGAYVLDNITISNNTNQIKIFNLKYYYTTSTIDGNGLQLLKNLEPQSSKRLFLSQILEYDESRYKFEYNSSILPNRFSSSQDSWGFYNGQNNGQFLSFFDGGNPSNSNNREVNTNLSKSGLLQKIVYPTKGTTEYIYEANIVKKSVFYDKIYTQNSNPTKVVSSGFFKNKSLWDGFSYKENFTISSSFVLNSLTSNVSLSGSQNCGDNVYVPGCFYRFILTGNGKTYELFKNKHPIYNITPGNYELEVVPADQTYEDPSDYVNTFNVLVSWKEYSISDNDNTVFAGGNRILQIVSRDYNEDIINQKSYQYNGADGKTSGIMQSLPAFFPITLATDNFFQFGNTYPVRPGGPLTSLQGNSLGYSAVTEYLGTLTNNIGKVDYLFTNTVDAGDFYLYPFCPPTDNEWLRGILLEKKYAKPINLGASYKTIKQEQYFYKFANEARPLNNTAPLDSAGFLMSDGSYPNFNPRVKKVFDFAQLGYEGSEFLSTTFYKYTYLFGAYDLDSVITTNFFDNSTSFETRTSYKYNYDMHYQKSEESYKTYNSSSDSTFVVKKYFYASELTNEANAALLNANNIKAIPLKIETFKKESKITEEKTIFKNWGNNIIAPEMSQSSKENQPLETKIKYDLIDNTNGNIQQYTKNDGTSVTVIWGYNKTQPIAKIENAKYSSIPANLIFAAQEASDSGTEASLLGALNVIRNAPELVNTFVTLYTYVPLVGVSTITDSRGNKITYEYDKYNRLQFVKDNNGDILNEYLYHYKK